MDKENNEPLAGLDDICHEIFVTLLAYKRLRFNQLLRTLKKLGVKIEKPTLKAHLDHLLEKGLVECQTGFQTAIYSLTEKMGFLAEVPLEDLRKWVEARYDDESLPQMLKPLKLSQKELLEKYSDEQLDKMATDDLNDVLGLSLFELKTFIGYDLKVDRFKSNADFWNFVGNPIYRMHEKSVALKCRDSERYRRMLFEKTDALIDELRSGKELLRKRSDKKSKASSPSKEVAAAT